MPNLPPRPDFADPAPLSRSDPRSHYHGARPIPPEHYRERERERDVYMSGRSSPRHKHPSRGAPDSYVAADRERDRVTYMSRDAYPPSYDRREHDDRHREGYRAERGWERRDYRDYPPPPPPSHSDYRYREPDPRGWTRESRDSGRPRYEDTARSVHARGSRKSPPRAWTQSDEIDRHPRGGRHREAPREPHHDEDRRWQTRPGLSPPRRYVGSTPGSPLAGSSNQLPRSPRRRSPSPDGSRAASLRRRSSRETLNPKPGDHPVPASPLRHPPYMSRRREEYPSRRGYRSRSRGPRHRSRSRSASPPKRLRSRTPARRDTREETLSPGRILEEGEREPSPAKTREPSAALHSRKDESPLRAGSSARPYRTDTPMDVDTKPSEQLPALKVDAPPANVKASEELEPPKSTSAGSATPQKANGESMSRPRSPLLQQRGLTKTPTTPMSPQSRSPMAPLPPKPEWSSTPQSTPTVPSAPPPVAEPAEDNLAAIKKELKDRYRMDFENPEPLPWANDEYDRLKNHQRRLELDYYTAARTTMQALYELDIAKIELASSTARRELAVKQLNLALDGKAGIDWPYDYDALGNSE